MNKKTQFIVGLVTLAAPVAFAAEPLAFTNASSPLHFDPGPTDGEAAVRIYVTSHNQPRIDVPMADNDKLKILPPLPVYRLPSRNKVITAGLEAVTQDGYLYAVLQGDFEMFDLVVHKTADGTPNTKSIFGTWYGEIGGGLINDALQELSAMEQVKAGSYEARLVKFPFPGNGYPTDAVWLKSKKDTNDLIYPIGRQPTILLPNIQYGRTYAPNEFFAILYPPPAAASSMASTNTSSSSQFDPGPTGSETAVRDFLNKYAGQPTFGSLDAGSLTIQPPLPVYRLPVKNGVVTAGLAAATRDGYLYPVLQGDKEMVDVTVHKNATGGTANTRNIFGAWFHENSPGWINNTLKEVFALEQVKAGSYEARLAVFPYPHNGNPSQAIWLKSQTDTNDLIYPMGQLPDIKNGRTYAPNEFFDILYSKAKQVN